MIRPSSRSKPCNWVSKVWEAAGVGSAARKTTIRRATWEMTGRSRAVRGKSEEAKEVASRALADVAWAIEAIPLVERVGFATSNSPKNRLNFKMPAYKSLGLRVD